MAEIIPAIIGQNFAEVENKIHQIERSVDWVHLDIMDGTMTDETSWQSPEDLKFLDGRIKVEAHLMIRSPEKVIEDWAVAADRILVHVEAAEHLTEILDFFTGRAAVGGLALNLATPISAVESWLDKTKLVQLMAIAEIGEQGHPFDLRVIEKIKHLRALHPDVTIQVDGGINLETARAALAAGANNLVVGSAIWQSPDPVAALVKFKKLQEASRSF
ncbi:MAG: hypothetical protein HY481_00675 [Candidatus Vogelbacteria bacterium]|nr:hypothetical protein [Candidatus Vogelbacteria bacterium]